MGGGSNSSSSSSRPLTPEERTQGFQAGMANMANASPGLFNKTTLPGNDPYVNVQDYEGNWVQQPNPNYVPARDSYTINSPQYQTPAYQTSNYTSGQPIDPGSAARLAGGDYNKLEQSILESRTAPLDYAFKKAQAGVDNDAAKRGVWSSGLAIQSQHDLVDRFAPELRAAAADANTARIGAEQADNNAMNTFNMSRAGLLTNANLAESAQKNSFNQTEAAQKNSFNMENANRKYNSAWTPLNYLKDLYNGTGGTISSGSGGGWNFSI